MPWNFNDEGAPDKVLEALDTKVKNVKVTDKEAVRPAKEAAGHEKQLKAVRAAIKALGPGYYRFVASGHMNEHGHGQLTLILATLPAPE